MSCMYDLGQLDWIADVGFRTANSVNLSSMSHLPLLCLWCRLWTKNPVQRSRRSLKTHLEDSTREGPAPRMAPGLEVGAEPGAWLCT